MAVPQSLPVRVYLLSYDIDKGKLTDKPKLGYLMRGAALTDLVLRGALNDADGKAVAGERSGTGDPVLDAVLAEIAADKPRRWKSLVRKSTKATFDGVQTQLADAGVIDWDRRTVLGVFPAHKVAVKNPTEVERLRGRTREAVVGGAPVERLEPLDAAAAALAATVPMRFVLSGKERRQYKARIEELSERSGAAVPALRKVFQEIQAATIAAATSAASAGSS